jgi:hypothetical protein
VYALADKKLNISDFKTKDLPQGTLVFTKQQGTYSKENYRLAYWFNVFGKGSFDAHKVYVDAETGVILNRISLVHQCFSSHNHSATIKTPETNTSPVPVSPSLVLPRSPRFLNRGGHGVAILSPNEGLT